MMAVNRQWIIDSTNGGQAVEASGPILPGPWAAAGDLGPMPFDPRASADLLDSLSWELPTGVTPGSPEYARSNGESSLEFTLTYPDDALHATIAQDLQLAWADIGARVELEAVDPGSLYSA